MYLFAFFLIYFFIVFVLRSVIVYRSTGINPFTFDNSDDAHAFNGQLFKIISAIELAILAYYAFYPEGYDYLLPFWYIEHDILTRVGWALLVISLIFVSIAQNQMSTSWRVGIDHQNTADLVTTGMFSISRNPIFLGIMIANIGLFLVLPNAFTLLITSLSYVTMNTQIRLEESFLEAEYGEEYVEYRNKVRRWI
jgi:protein-S-isoprenylcysteine O-methyltransferase Ste14